MRKAGDLDKIVTFLKNIGIAVKFGPFEDKAFLRGTLLDKGSLLIDLDKDPFLDDILHEAGHIEVLGSDIRYASRGEITGEDGEMAAMLWS